MLSIAKLPVRIGLVSIVVIAACAAVLDATVPLGWYVAGSKPGEYQTGVDADVQYNNHPSAFLKARKTTVDGFGTLMQDFHADKYVGQRVRFSAYVKSEEVQDWAGLWMRVDKDSKAVSFDNMKDRPIKGTTGWQNYRVVLDVPQDATGIYFGILLTGGGAVWINTVKFEVVGSEVPTTGARYREGPTNLDFKE
jgi:hypothetical protein